MGVQNPVAVQNLPEMGVQDCARLRGLSLSDSIEFYDQVAVKELGRSPRHVLLLHENDVAALYLGDLVKKLRNSGWKIISPELAFQDRSRASSPTHWCSGKAA